MMNRSKTLKHLSMTAAASALLLCGGALTTQQVKAETPMGIARVNYNGKGKVRLMDVSGHFVNQYVSPNSSWKVFEKQMVGGEYAYRIGNKHQWLPAQYAEISGQQSSSNASVATNRSAANGVLRVSFNGKGSVRLVNSAGHFVDQYVSRDSQWRVFEKATINGQTMYRIGSESQWIPAQYSALQAAEQKPATQKPAAPAQKPTTPVQKPSTGSSRTPKTWKYEEAQEAARYFINYVNAWRVKEGLVPFTQDNGWLQDGAVTRCSDNMQLFNTTGDISHTRPGGRSFDTAFHPTNGGRLYGENIGYVGNSNGLTPKQAAEAIAKGFIDEGPTGGHYAILHADYGKHPLIGVCFNWNYGNGMYVYIMNMETGTNN